MTFSEAKPPVAAQPLYPHTLSAPSDSQTQGLAAPPDAKVDIDALAALYVRTMSATLYLDRALSDADRQGLLDQHQLVAEFDAVRGVDAVHQP